MSFEQKAILMNMKILFSTVPGLGHMIPLLPLARAFAQQGHQVAVLASAGLADFLVDEPVEHLQAGPMYDVLFDEVARRTGQDAKGDAAVDGVAEFFGAVRMDLGADAALQAATPWSPDLVVCDVFDVIGPLVSATLGLPLAMLTFGPEMPEPIMHAVAASASPRFVARGLPALESMPTGTWLLDTCPDLLGSWSWPTMHRLPLQPQAHSAATASSPEADDPTPGARPRVLVSFGSVFSDPAVVGAVVDGVTDSGLDVDVVATAGVLARPEDVPVADPRVQIVPFVPLAELLRGVDLVLTHGGAGTTLAALSKGIPLVVMPQGADQFMQAAAVERAGAGRALPPGPPDPTLLRAAVQDVMTQPRYARAAMAVAAQVAGMPTPAAVAARLAEDVASVSRVGATAGR
jgi:UDP:flavonoid glycosyltransferase YjiC (YdhE family)